MRIRRTLALVVLVAATVVAWAASALPAFGADSGTVDATVTVATPCILISPPTVDFGSMAFRDGSEEYADLVANPQTIGYTNCSEAAENIFARGTNAADANGATASWALDPGLASCPQTPDVFGMALTDATLGGVQLALDNAQLEGALAPALAPGATGGFNMWHVIMPCTGSSGAGATMAMSVIFTATF